jgi:hypothetical protein
MFLFVGTDLFHSLLALTCEEAALVDEKFVVFLELFFPQQSLCIWVDHMATIPILKRFELTTLTNREVYRFILGLQNTSCAELFFKSRCI